MKRSSLSVLLIMFVSIILNGFNISYAMPLPSQVNYSFSGTFIFNNNSEMSVIPISGKASFSLLHYEDFSQFQYLNYIDWGIHLSGNEGLFTLDARLFRDEAILLPSYSGWVNTYDTRYEGFGEAGWDSYVAGVNENYSSCNWQPLSAGGMIVRYSDELWDHEDNTNFLPSSMAFEFGETFDNRGICEITLQTIPVPEPSFALLLSSGLAGLVWYEKKRNKRKAY